MKNIALLLLLSFIVTSSFGQSRKAFKKGKSSYSKIEWTIITTDNGTVRTKSPSYNIVFNQKGKYFDGTGYIETIEGDQLKIGGEIRASYTYANSAGQPTAQNGTITDVTNSVTHSDGGHTITISTTVTTKGADGSITSTNKTTTIDTKTGESSRSTTVTNGQGTPEGGDVVIIVE